MDGCLEETVGWSIGEWRERVVMDEVVEESQDGKVQEEEHTCIISVDVAWKHRGRNRVHLRGLAR